MNPHELSSSNHIAPSDQAIHRWYRFVLAYPPHLVRHIIDQWDLGSQDRLLDPFCGTGTTLVTARMAGIPSVGLEPHPLARFASRVKQSWDVPPDRLDHQAHAVAHRTTEELESATSLRTLPPSQHDLLIRDSISPRPLHRTLVLRDAIRSVADPEIRPLLELALATALVTRISNLRFRPEVSVGTIREDVDVVGAWMEVVQTFIEDLRTVPISTLAGQVMAGDARDAHLWLPSHSVSAVITSPPYPNEKDYTRTSRLEAVILGYIPSREELRVIKRTLLRSNTRGVYAGDDDAHWVEGMPRIQRLATQIEARRIEMGKTSGFERMYAKTLLLYFGGMTRHLANLRSVLRPGAKLAYVVGDQASYFRILVPTGELLEDIATSLGYRVLHRQVFRTRAATATRTTLNEEIVTLEWPHSP